MVPKEAILKDLRNAIATGEIKPGEHLKESVICSRYRVSRTPVREILKQLEKEGLVEIIPNQGAKIVTLSIEDVADIYDVLIVLEGAAARLAAGKISDQELEKLREYQFTMEKAIGEKNVELVLELNLQFHTLLTKASRNPYLVETRNNYRNILNPFGRFIAFIPQFFEATLIEHPKMIASIASKNPSLAEFLAREHMEEGKIRMLDYIQTVQKKGIEEKTHRQPHKVQKRNRIQREPVSA